MYEFHDLKKTTRAEPSKLPLEAVKFNGKWLDEISSFTTLTVKGRHTLERDVNYAVSSGDGGFYLSSRLGKRTIEVRFRWSSTDIQKYNEDMSELNSVLFSTQSEVRFADEPDYYFVGTVSKIEFENDSLSTTGTMAIECIDPYKYGQQKVVSGTGSLIGINDSELKYPQTPTLIEFIPSIPTSSVIITNSLGKKIEINQSVPSGQKIVINFIDLMIKINELNALMNLTLSSNFSDFHIKNGTSISLNGTGSYKLVYEVKTL